MIEESQKTNQGCLAVCLLKFVKRKVNYRVEEFDILANGLKFKDSFAFGICKYFAKKYKINLKIIIENKFYFNFLFSSPTPFISLQNSKINLDLIDFLNKPLIVYVDSTYFGHYVRVPHFIFIDSSTLNFYRIFDPWTGKYTRIKKQRLYLAILSLKANLRFSPVLIILS